MLLQGLIPLFLVVYFPLESNVAPKHGLEYIFSVNMDFMWTRAGIKPFGYRVLSRLHCIPKRAESKHVICSLRHQDRIDFGRKELADNLDRQKDVGDEPIELVFDQKEGITQMIVGQQMRPYDLYVFRLVAENLYPGDDFSDVGEGTFEGVVQSTVGRCSVTFDISHRPGNTTHRGFDLFLLPPNLYLRNGTIIIDKTTNLDNCSCYAENYYCKYGHTVVCEDQLLAELESMVSRMEISENSFVSSTVRKGRVRQNAKTYKTYDVVETTKIALEEVRVATDDLPEIVYPGRTKIQANYDVTSMSTDDEQL